MKRLAVFFITHFVISLSAYNQSDTKTFVISNNDNEGTHSITPFAKILADHGHDVSFDDIVNNKNDVQEKFKSLNQEIPYLGFTTGSYWVKFSIQNLIESEKKYYLEIATPLVNKVDMYIQRENKEVEIIKHGDALPFNNRTVKHRKIVFPVKFGPNERATFYFRLESDGEVIALPIRLWRIDAWSNKNYKEQYLFGIYFGILLFVIIIYSFFYKVLRDRVFLYFVLYVAALGLFQLTFEGLAYQFLWPNWPWLGNHAILILASLSTFMIIVYARNYLGVHKSFKKLDLLFKTVAALVAVTFCMAFLSGPIYAFVFPFLNILSLLSILMVLFSTLYLKVKGINTHPSFVIAISCFLVGAIIFILKNLNVIPNNLFTEHALKFGSAFEVTFLSITMADKYRDIQREKEEAQMAMVKQLEETNKMKEEINTRLEEKVKQRTHKIKLQNARLEEKNTEILDSIHYAKRLQDAILPPIKLVKEYFNESFILFRPKDIVSGDFYWMETRDNLIMFAAADCTGHGVPGAMVSVVCANALNKAVNELGQADPAEILNTTREIVIETFSRSNNDVKDGMDISLCVLNEGTETLHWAGANNPLWIVRRDQNEIETIKADKQPIGMYGQHKPFTSHSIKINGGDSIYMFSDGYADQFGGVRGKKMKTGKFKELLLEHRHENMDQQKQALEKAFEEWQGDLEQIDDVCVIGVRLTEKEGNPFTRREMEIIQLLEQGQSSKIIADQLNISKSTVDTHRRKILKKVDAGNVTALLRICKDKKWV